MLQQFLRHCERRKRDLERVLQLAALAGGLTSEKASGRTRAPELREIKVATDALKKLASQSDGQRAVTHILVGQVRSGALRKWRDKRHAGACHRTGEILPFIDSFPI